MPSSTSSSDAQAARRALLALAGVFALLNLAALAVWLAVPFTQVSTGRYLAAVDDHLAMLEVSKGEERRVILIGGSGAAFSISAEKLGQSLNRPVINGGIQASIGYRNLIDLYTPHLDPEHDTIVLVPELELLADDARYSQTWCDVIFLRKAAGDLARQPRCVPFVIYRTWQELRYHMDGTSGEDPVYRRSGFNQVGDMTAHLTINKPAPDFAGYRLPTVDDAVLTRFEDYVRSAFIERGFKVIYIPAAMPQTACTKGRAVIGPMVERLSALSTGPRPRHDLARFCLSSDLFFDGAGHLNRKGRMIQTENVRRALAETVVGRDAN